MTLEIDFTSGALAHRVRFSNGKNQPLPRAIGAHKNKQLHVLDTTAGLGRDAYILASLGCQVTLIERNPEVYQALSHAIDHARDHHDAAASRMYLIHANSIDYLQTLHADALPDVIYIDPMFPKSKKSRLVKKNMVTLRTLVGDDNDAEQLFSAAQGKASNRIVIKRAKLDDYITAQAPSFSQVGKSNRFDIYLTPNIRADHVTPINIGAKPPKKGKG